MGHARQGTQYRQAGGSGYRAVFIGDSYLEFQLTRLTVPGEVERRFIEAGQPKAEMINLGISATGPRSYYYRMRDVAFALSPDALAVFFFSGNDFLYDGQGYGQGLLPDLVSEAPGGSILATSCPTPIGYWSIACACRRC